MGVLQALGVSRPDTFLGFVVGGIEVAPAILRTEIMNAFVIADGQMNFVRVNRLAANGVHSAFGNHVGGSHGKPPHWFNVDAFVTCFFILI